MNTSPSREPSRQPPVPWTRLAAYAVLGAVLGTALSGVVWVLATRNPLPALTSQRLEQARELWQRHGPESYRMTILLGSPQQQAAGEEVPRIVVQVEKGKPISVTQQPGGMLPRRVWDYWTVPGLFDVLQRDLENRQHPQRAFGVSSPEMVVLRCRFDPQYGFPRQYQRVVRSRGLQSRWTVTHFEPLP